MSVKKDKELELKKEIAYDKNDAELIEGYDRLKDNLLYLNADGKNKVISVISSVEGEGKTTVCANLAVGLGLTDKKVVVLDLDFKSGDAEDFFDMKIETGISEYMLGQIEYKDLIKQTKYKNVSIISKGENIHNSSLVLISQKFTSLIQSLREEFDYVLIDTSPVLQSSNFMHVVRMCDGVLFLARYGKTTRNKVEESVKQLKTNGAKILGSVFTMVRK